MTRTLLIAGGGIAGMSAAIVATRAGWNAAVYEQSASFSDAGAGVQLGPNATRLLAAWGLGEELQRIADEPAALVVRDARCGARLARMVLGSEFRARYGAPYLTLHRADLHALLTRSAHEAGAAIKTGIPMRSVDASADLAWLELEDGTLVNGDALLGADGLWSTVRGKVLNDGGPRATGHLAYRALIERPAAPANEISVWLGPRLHVVAYPVRQGAACNVVAIVHGKPVGDARNWDLRGAAADLHQALGSVAGPLQELIAAASGWRVWALHDRQPMQSAGAMARGRIALAGDAAHPMLPYLAQGAAMAIEDAQALGAALKAAGAQQNAPVEALRRYADARWQRNARLQARAARNGRIFHAQGPLRWGRDVALRVLGERLLDQPWLYGKAQDALSPDRTG